MPDHDETDHEHADEIDEFVLNTLLAEGLDLPTAWEASRLVDHGPERDAESSPPLTLYAALLLAALVALWMLLS